MIFLKSPEKFCSDKIQIQWYSSSRSCVVYWDKVNLLVMWSNTIFCWMWFLNVPWSAQLHPHFYLLGASSIRTNNTCYSFLVTKNEKSNNVSKHQLSPHRALRSKYVDNPCISNIPTTSSKTHHKWLASNIYSELIELFIAETKLWYALTY